MSGIATAIGVTGALGIGGAIIGADAARKGGNAAADATRDATAQQIASNERMYNQGRDDFAPFRNLAPQSLATLQSSIYGTPQGYSDPNYREATQADIDAANKTWLTEQPTRPPASGFASLGDLPQFAAMQEAKTLENSPYKLGMYIGPDGQFIDKASIPQLQTTGQQFDLENFTPEGTAAYEWQKSRTLEDLGNYFNLTGRGRGSTVQSNATGRALGDLNAAEYDKGYNRLFQRKQDYTNDLLNLVKTAQGAAGSTSSLGAQAAGNTSQAYQNQGNTLANIAQNQGQTQANLYAGIVPATMNTIGTGMQLNSLYPQSGTTYKPNGEFI